MELDKLIASRFVLFFKDKAQQWEQYLNQSLAFFQQVDRKFLSNYFRLNDTAQRVHSFYQHQEINASMWVGVAQKELAKTRIENIRLYYYKSWRW